MAADLDMEAPGGEGWGEDAELQLDEGEGGFGPSVGRLSGWDDRSAGRPLVGRAWVGRSCFVPSCLGRSSAEVPG